MGRNWKCHVIIVIRTDLSGFVVTMHSGLCEQYVKSLGLTSGFDLLFRNRPRALWQETPPELVRTNPLNPMTSDPGVTSNVNVEQTQPKMPNKDVTKPSNQPVNSEAVTSHTVSFTGVSSTTNDVLSPSGARTRVLLQSVRVKVHGVGGVVDATVLYDTGSDHSYITTDLVRKVGPERLDAQPMSYAAFGTGKPSVSELHNIYNVILESSQGSGHSLHCTEVPVICAPIWCLPTWCQHLVSCSLLTFMVQVRRSRLIFL